MTRTTRLTDYTPDERISVIAWTEIQPGDHDWGGLTLGTSLRYALGKRNPPTLANLISGLSVRASGSDLPDDRTDRHHNYIDVERGSARTSTEWGMEWQSTRLEREFKDNPRLTDQFGLDNQPSQSRLWEVFHESWSQSRRGSATSRDAGK